MSDSPLAAMSASMCHRFARVMAGRVVAGAGGVIALLLSLFCIYRWMKPEHHFAAVTTTAVVLILTIYLLLRKPNGVAKNGTAAPITLLTASEVSSLSPRVVAVHLSSEHAFTKSAAAKIRLIEGLGVEGDAHAGKTVKHRSRIARGDGHLPNLRQVHLMHSELFDQVRRGNNNKQSGSNEKQGKEVKPGDLGENITTKGVEILQLPKGTRLRFLHPASNSEENSEVAEIQLTGLRNPCDQIEKFQTGLLSKCIDWTTDGTMIRKAGVMSIVLKSGEVQPGDKIQIELPPQPHELLAPV